MPKIWIEEAGNERYECSEHGNEWDKCPCNSNQISSKLPSLDAAFEKIIKRQDSAFEKVIQKNSQKDNLRKLSGSNKLNKE